MTVRIRKIISTVSAVPFVARLAAGALCIIVFVVALTGLSLYQSRRQYEEQAIVSTQNLAQGLEQSIDDIIDKADFALLAVTDEVKREFGSGGIDERTLNPFIARQKERLGTIDSLRMTDAQGTVRYGPGVESSPRTNLADRDHFLAQRNDPNAALFIGKPIFARISKKWVIPLSRRLNRPDGSFAGTVYANIELDTFVTMFSSLNVGPNGTIALRDSELGVIARYPESQKAGSTIGNKAASPQLLEMIHAGRNAGTWHSYSAIDKIERVFSFCKTPHYPLYVVVGRATSEYLSDWRKEAIKMLLLLALFTAAIVVSSWQMFLRQKREKQAWEELRMLNAGLEDRIAARTAEVSRFNEQLQAELAGRKRTEEKLRVAVVNAKEEQAKTEAIIAGMGDAVSIQDTNYSILYQNEASKDIYGDHVGEYCYRAYQNKDHVCERCHLAMAFKDGMVHTLEQKRTTEDGLKHYEITASPVRDFSGKIVSGIELVRDITERKKAQEAKDRLLNAISVATEGIAITDDKDRFIYVNDAHARIFGWLPAELIGKTWRDSVTPELVPLFERELSKTLHNRAAGIWSGECPALRKDGTILPTEITATSRWDETGNYLGHICIVRDITERKLAEGQIKESLGEKEVLLKEIHHRVKNNLQIVASMLQLQSGYIKDKEAKILFEESQKRVESMSLIHERLYRSKDLARIDFREYIDDLAGNLHTLNADKAKTIEMRLDIEEGMLDINNSIPCGLIINELVSNALRHAFPNGRKGKIEIGMHRDREGNVAIVVSDNGIGFPDGIDFRNTQSLGMQLVTSLVGQLSGTIKLERNEGTSFEIVFHT